MRLCLPYNAALRRGRLYFETSILQWEEFDAFFGIARFLRPFPRRTSARDFPVPS